MGELGQLLRQAREAKGLSLAQAEEATKIRSVFLQALEEENYDRLPPQTYVKGFLKNYARYLSLDAEQVLALYPEREAVPETTGVPRMLDEPLQPFALRRFWPIWVALCIIVLAAAGWLVYTRYYGGTVPFSFSFRPQQATATPTITPVPPSPTAVPTATPLPSPSPSPTASPTSTPVIGLNLSIEIVGQPSWIRVELDGQAVFTGTLQPGASNSWTARERIVVRSGNAGAVSVTLNGQVLGFLGQVGQVVEKEWTVPGVPTRTIRPVSSPTSTP